ncbi:torsin-1A-interacting protein 2-like isoform X2 [Girardinichthys multiradiatus]|uniref:torsin-1A-interacting protein 2-like isoform X2 n=1 Tax=Girardinichthys multiradiatus TaxID=208333 RepID=UPI001FADA15B|nr:torsin-1A-interacting protein 2-like isoform X2 [Girardinichthys multiradiatus]
MEQEQEPKPGCQQPDDSGKSTVKLPGEDLPRNETEQKPATSKTAGSNEECVVDKPGINEEPAATNSDVGEAFKDQRKETPPRKQSTEQREDVEPIGPTPKEAAESKVSKDTEILEDLKYDDKEQLEYVRKLGDCGPDGDQKAFEATPTDKETTKTSKADEVPEDGDADSANCDSLDKNSGQQADDESQDDSTGDWNEKSADAESEKVDHSLKMDKKTNRHSKGEPLENEKPVSTTPDKCPSRSVTSDADLAKGDYLLTREKKPGQQAREANNAAADEHFSPGVPRTSQMSQEEPPKEDIEKQMKKMRKKEKADVETIGPTTTQAELSEETGILGGSKRVFMAVVVVVLVAILTQHFLQSKSPPQKNDLRQVEVFLKRMEEVKTRFPNQRAELWSRSEIHLKRHLQTSQPAEPVSLILTSGFKAEKTMRCLARDVASAFSTALNASVLHIDGASKAGQDSDQVKLDIDRNLEGAFQGDKPVAVIHRLEELPPGSTLIFYRYCDHENAAYKKTFLIFTVLLGDEEEIQDKIRLSVVEEMVDDHLQKRFLSHSHPVSFDRMDLNKYGGLWSRISHLILPVAAEERIEHEGCKRTQLCPELWV